MDQTHDYIHEYRGYHSPGGRCRIRIYEQDGLTPVIIASELPDNTNTSITNMVEYLAPEIIAKHFPHRLEEDEPAVWIEHYGPPTYRGKEGKPEFSRVRFSSWTPRVDTQWQAGQMVRRIKFGEPEWDYLPPEEVESLVGHPINPKPTL